MGFLRFLLALMVIFVHTGMGGDGRLAVETFYMISGFYMSLVWVDKYASHPNPIRTFYISRALRIYPLYFIVLLGSVLMALYLWQSTPQFTVSNPVETPLSWGAMLWVYMTQISLIGMEISIFYGLHGYWISPVAWTLGLELTFYLLVPLLMPRPRLMLGIFIASLGARYVAYHQFSWQGNPDYASICSYRFFPFEIALFLAGVFAHGILTKISDRLLVIITSLKFIILTVLVLTGAFGVHMLAHINFHKLLARLNIQAIDLPFAQITDMQYFWSEASYWCFYATVFFGIIVLFQNTKRSKFDSKIGELSYPMYILHLQLFGFYSTF